MNSATVIPLEGARGRGRRLARAMDARRRLDRDRADERRGRRRARGRAWLNGHELGEPASALSHLAESYD